MPTLTTSKGQTFEVEYAWAPAPDGGCHIQLRDTRRTHEIAADFDGCQTLTYTDPVDGERVFSGYTAVRQITRFDNGRTTVRLKKEE